METALLAHVAAEARRRGLRRLSVRPASRDVDAIHGLHAAGYEVLSAVELTLDLSGQFSGRGDRLNLHDLHFSY